MTKFGFIAHPIDIDSFYNFFGHWDFALRLLPRSLVYDLVKKLKPFKLCHFEKIRSSKKSIVSADIVAIPLLPIHLASMSEDKSLEIIEQGIRICEESGCEVVGLGGFTSVIGNEGEVLSKRVKVTLTSGNTLTASLALDGIYQAARYMDINLENTTAAVIGATGDIGSVCTKILSKIVKNLHVVARREKNLDTFISELASIGCANIVKYKYAKDAVRNADIVLTATSSITTIIDPEYLKPGCVVCDVSIPANIAREVVQIRDDVLVFEGGLAKLPFMEDLKHMKLRHLLPSKGLYGCVAETLTLAFEKRIEPFSLGRGNITEKKVYEIKQMAAKHGIEVSDFFCGYKFFTEKDIENIKEQSINKKERLYASKE